MRKIVLILLAAGDSRRFKGNKLLYNIGGKPMYRHLTDELENLTDAFFYKKIVVTQYPEIAEELSSRGYETVENLRSDLGISHSIRMGLEAAPEPDASFCFAVCDQPYVKAASIRALIEGWESSGKGLGCLCRGPELGNPAVFSGGYRAELLELHGDAGGKKVIRRHMEDVYLCQVEDGRELADIDERADGV